MEKRLQKQEKCKMTKSAESEREGFAFLRKFSAGAHENGFMGVQNVTKQQKQNNAKRAHCRVSHHRKMSNFVRLMGNEIRQIVCQRNALENY